MLRRETVASNQHFPEDARHFRYDGIDPPYVRRHVRDEDLMPSMARIPRLEATYHFLGRVVVRRELLAAPIAPSLELALYRPLLKRLSVPVVVTHRRQASASSWLSTSPGRFICTNPGNITPCGGSSAAARVASSR